MSKATWIIAASSAKAEIYKKTLEGAELVKTLTHSESRLKSGELLSDEAGHYQSGAGGGGQYSPRTDAHQQEHVIFAKEIAHFLEVSKQENQYQALILCAEPRFYGLLNHAIKEPVRKLISKVVEKDYLSLPRDKMNLQMKTIAHEQF